MYAIIRFMSWSVSLFALSRIPVHVVENSGLPSTLAHSTDRIDGVEWSYTILSEETV